MKEIHRKINNLYKSFEEKANETIEEINELMINRKSYLIKSWIEKILKNLLYIENF